jgi:hypothetical protein
MRHRNHSLIQFSEFGKTPGASERLKENAVVISACTVLYALHTQHIRQMQVYRHKKTA